MIIGTAGHIDHGKTSLVQALTGVDTDRLKEEKARGISIELGFAYLPVEGADTLGFVDVPGHERFVHTMLAGASGIDFVLLVVAADDGVMPQTREHLAIIDLLGIEHGIVALTKADLVPQERLAEVEAAIRAEIAGTAIAGARIFAVSTVSGLGIPALRDEVASAARAFRRRQAGGRFRLAVDRCFTMRGAGTIVTGTVLSGSVAVGEQVIVSPSGLMARIRSIHAQDTPSETGRASDRCALNLVGPGIEKEAVHRGDMVLDKSLHAPTGRIDAMLTILATEPKPIGHWFPVRLHHGSAEVGARIVLLSGETAAPGSRSLAQLVLDQPIAATAGDRFIIRDTSARRTVGGGRFLDLRAPARKRRTPERMAQLAAHAEADPISAMAALLAAPPFYADAGTFSRDRAMTSTEAGALVQVLDAVQLPSDSAVLAMSPMGWEKFRAALLDRLETYHAENPDLLGIGIEKLRMQVEPRLPTPAFRSALGLLVEGNAVVVDGAWVRLAGHQVSMTPADEQMWARIEPLLGGTERFRPPRVRDIGEVLALPEQQVRRLLKLCGRMGKVHEVAHDRFFLRETAAEMVAIAAELSASETEGWFSAMAFRDRINNGRKVAIQILDFFDYHGVTMRRGDLRRINRNRLDLFGIVPGGFVEKPVVSGGDASPVGRPDFKSGRGRETVFGGFDSHSLPPDTI